jgi:hypothetical protein
MRFLKWTKSTPWSQTSTLHDCEKINSCSLNQPIYGISLRQPEQDNTKDIVSIWCHRLRLSW